MGQCVEENKYQPTRYLDRSLTDPQNSPKALDTVDGQNPALPIIRNIP